MGYYALRPARALDRSTLGDYSFLIRNRAGFGPPLKIGSARRYVTLGEPADAAIRRNSLRSS